MNDDSTKMLCTVVLAGLLEMEETIRRKRYGSPLKYKDDTANGRAIHVSGRVLRNIIIRDANS